MVYYVEDDTEIRNLIIYTLKTSGFEAKGFENGAELFSELKIKKPDLILLDVMLPGMDGVEILKKIKANPNSENIPIIMATARGSEYDKITALNLGADDYLTKPFGMLEMVARIKAVLRRVDKNEKRTIFSNGKIEIREENHLAFVNNEPITLTLKEYDLLLLFLKNIGKVFSRDRLLEAVWGEDFLGETRTIDVHIGTLRTKLKNQGYLIETVRGVGYKMEKYDEKENI